MGNYACRFRVAETNPTRPTGEVKEKNNEKNLSTQKKTKKQSARFQSKNEDHRRTQNAC